MAEENEELLLIKSLRDIQEGSLLAMREMNNAIKDLEKRIKKLEEVQKIE